MTATLICTRCGSDLEVTGDRTDCPSCGESYDTSGLAGSGSGGGSSETRSEKEEQLAGKRLMRRLRPDARIYDTSQPHQAKITPGLPDWLVFDPELGLFFYEWKAEGGRLTEAQEDFRDACQQAGVAYYHGTVRKLAQVIDSKERKKDGTGTPAE